MSDSNTIQAKHIVIKFFEHHSFVGEHMTMHVNSNCHNLIMTDSQTYAQHAVLLLKELYNIDFNVEDVKFESTSCL